MKYFKLEDKRICYVDVDDTLIMWNADINDPQSKVIEVMNGNLVVYFHKEHIQLIKDLYAIGWNIVIWSQGGSDHAEKVVQACQLENYVHVISPKPENYIDDLSFEAQGITRKYKPFEKEK